MNPLVVRQQFKGLADAGQHAETENIHLYQAQRVQIILVPFHKGSVLHRPVADRNDLLQGLACQHEPSDMLGQVARETDQLVGERHGAAQQRVGGIKAGLAQAQGRRLPGLAALPVPQRPGKCRGGVLGKPHGLADISRRAAGPVADHGGGKAGAVAAVAAVDVLDDLLAPFMLEIDVDVRGLPALA